MSFDNADANLAFGKKFNFNFPLLCDTSREMGKAYGAAPLIGAAKRIGVIIGPDGKVKQYFPKVSAAAFPGEALALI